MPSPLSADSLLVLPAYVDCLASLATTDWPQLPALSRDQYDKARMYTGFYGFRADGFYVGFSRRSGVGSGVGSGGTSSSVSEEGQREVVKSEFERYEVHPAGLPFAPFFSLSVSRSIKRVLCQFLGDSILSTALALTIYEYDSDLAEGTMSMSGLELSCALQDVVDLLAWGLLRHNPSNLSCKQIAPCTPSRTRIISSGTRSSPTDPRST